MDRSCCQAYLSEKLLISDHNTSQATSSLEFLSCEVFEMHYEHLVMDDLESPSVYEAGIPAYKNCSNVDTKGEYFLPSKDLHAMCILHDSTNRVIQN